MNISIPSYLEYIYFCYRASANTGTGGLNPMEVDGFLQVAKKLDSLGGNNLAGAFASLTGGGVKGIGCPIIIWTGQKIEISIIQKVYE